MAMKMGGSRVVPGMEMKLKVKKNLPGAKFLSVCVVIEIAIGPLYSFALFVGFPTKHAG